MSSIVNEEAFSRELAIYDARLRGYEEQLANLNGEIERLHQEIIHDPDTKLYSNAYFLSRLHDEIVRSERYRHFLSLILVHLETVNNQSTQDLTRELRKIGLELTAGLARRTDLLALYSKRQMVIMLPETDARGAANLVMRYEAMFPSNGRNLSYLTLTYPQDASNIELVQARLRQMSENLFRGTNSSLR